MGYNDKLRDVRICLDCVIISVSLDYKSDEHTRMCMACGKVWKVKHDRSEED